MIIFLPTGLNWDPVAKKYGGKDVTSDDQSSKVSTSETSAGSSGSL